jgi:uncharacterized protein (TIGR02246 family)
MKRLTCAAFAICISTFAIAGPQEDGQAVFDKFLGDFTAANPDAIAAHFAQDALFWGTNSRDLISGTNSIRQYFSDAFKRLPGAKATPVGKVSVLMIADNVMTVSGIWQVERTVEGKTVTGQSRNSVTLVKRDGRWLIVSFANSPRPAGQ